MATESVFSIVRFDASLYSAEIVERAAYRFIDRMAIDLSADGNHWICQLRFGPDLAVTQVEFIADSFRKEVLDQKLRATIRDQTETIRTLILARAFSRTGLAE